MAIEEYKALTNKLLAHRKAGGKEDDLLDEMDILWDKLTKEEKQEINNIMTATNAIKAHILNQILPEAVSQLGMDIPTEASIHTAEELWMKVYEDDNAECWKRETMEDFRHGGVPTRLGCEYSRNYESESRACQLPTGEWVGWTRWYGGGKHSQPDAIDWISDAYFLEVEEKEVTKVVRTFKRIGILV
jgi:hypothetical protein